MQKIKTCSRLGHLQLGVMIHFFQNAHILATDIKTNAVIGVQYLAKRFETKSCVPRKKEKKIILMIGWGDQHIIERKSF